jgi:hypothetical protein
MTKARLAEWFTDKLLVDYYQWRLTLPSGSRRGTRYKSMITRLGGVGAMKQLLRSTGNRRKRSEFGAEYFVTLPQFRPLFTQREIAEAKIRLKANK